MAGRQNAIYTIFFSQTYLTSILVYLGFGPAAVVVLGVKSTITTMAHSSIPWDKPLYRYKALHPIAWIVERVISTPATHHAHHASTTDDGIGYYKGNFGNMFFLWDVIFGTGYISRQYPKEYGISHYEGDPWYAQLLWPIFKSNIPGSELAADGPVVRTDAEPGKAVEDLNSATCRYRHNNQHGTQRTIRNTIRPGGTMLLSMPPHLARQLRQIASGPVGPGPGSRTPLSLWDFQTQA